jgi:hypothetical protein
MINKISRVTIVLAVLVLLGASAAAAAEEAVVPYPSLSGTWGFVATYHGKVSASGVVTVAVSSTDFTGTGTDNTGANFNLSGTLTRIGRKKMSGSFQMTYTSARQELVASVDYLFKGQCNKKATRMNWVWQEIVGPYPGIKGKLKLTRISR